MRDRQKHIEAMVAFLEAYDDNHNRLIDANELAEYIRFKGDDALVVRGADDTIDLRATLKLMKDALADPKLHVIEQVGANSRTTRVVYGDGHELEEGEEIRRPIQLSKDLTPDALQEELNKWGILTTEKPSGILSYLRL